MDRLGRSYNYNPHDTITQTDPAPITDATNAIGSARSSQWSPSPPRDRLDFEIAIICALPLEASTVSALFDKKWDSQSYGKAAGDSNAYSFGLVGHHNVVLVHMPNMGKVAAATAAAGLCASFQRVNLALVVGICGGAPFGKHKGEILLGDVVVSEGLIQYDLGRRFPNNRFARKDTPRDNLPRPNPEIRAALAKLQAEHDFLQDKVSEYLSVLQQRLGEAVEYPGATEDRLFKSTYQHKHHQTSECTICPTGNGKDNVCDTALGLNCEQLGCDTQELVPRIASVEWQPTIHFGLIASGDTVMKSGEDRDDIAARDSIIAFEMEGAGVWENIRGCLVIKGICDYADSHKDKRWQKYAAATATAATKVFLDSWDNRPSGQSPRQPESRRQESPARNIKSHKDPTQATKEIDILKRLYTSRYEDGKNRNPNRTPGTCEWFVSHALFQEWQENKGSTTLWVSADPGCGKSVLAKHLVDSVLLNTVSRTTCYFFFKDDFEDQRSAVSALCCILHQLFKQKRILLSEAIIEQFEIYQEEITSSFARLWNALLDAAKDNNAGEIVCVLDAIDECEEIGRSQLAQALGKLYETGASFNIKFLLTSRPYIGIRHGFRPVDVPKLAVIHLSGESEIEMIKISKEIDVFIQARVQVVKEKLELRDDERDVMLCELMRIPNRTYLWVHLTLDLIERDYDIDKTGIIRATSHLPKTVEEAYERILSRSRNLVKAKKLLHIVVAAARPLTLNEMNLALALRRDHQSYSNIHLKSEERFRENVRDLCGLFIVVIGSKIYLLHQTAKEFLVQKNPGNELKPTRADHKWKQSLRPQESHHILAKLCMRYLLLAEFEADPVDGIEMIPQYCDSHVFLDYSARNWTTHLRESLIEVKNPPTQSMLKLCDTTSSRCQNWFMIYWRSTNTSFPERFNTLMIASYFGLTNITKLILERDNIDLNLKDSRYKRSALSWAAGNGFHGVVKLLLKGIHKYWKGIKLPLKARAQVHSVDRNGLTPLSHAVLNGHVAVAKLLLKAGARADARDSIGGTPLDYAILTGNEYLLNLLFKRGNHVVSENDISTRLLMAAVKQGNEDIVKLLLDRGRVDPNSKDTKGGTPLSLAITNGHKRIVELLVERPGAEIEVTDELLESVTALDRPNRNEMIVILINGPKYGLAITEEAVLNIIENFSEQVIAMLLDRRGDQMPITEDIILSALKYFQREEILLTLLNQRGNQIPITEKIILTAVEHFHGEEILSTLLNRQGDQVPITENVIIAAARNSLKGEAIIAMLLDWRGDKVPITENVIIAAARNYWKGEAIIAMLLDWRGDKVPITENVIIAAARNYRKGEAIIAMLLDQRGDKVPITENVIIAAAENSLKGEAIIAMLLDQRGDQVSITKGVLEAAKKKSAVKR